MNFGLSINANIEQEKSNLITKLSDDLNDYLANKDYGPDIKSYSIGIVAVAPEFEQFFSIHKPKYIKGKKTINPDGIPFTFEDSFEYSIKIDYEKFNNANEAECRRLLTEGILQSLDILDNLKQIKEFDKDRFKQDLNRYFIEN